MEALREEKATVLVVAHRFSVGYGGVPESILLLACALRKIGFRLDVLSREGLTKRAGDLTNLPPFAGYAPFTKLVAIDLAPYSRIVVAGAWNPLGFWIAVRARIKGLKLIYAPKGNLARIEFERRRDIKKFPYLVTLELSLLAMSDRIIFSSELERANSLLMGAFRRKATVIPEPFVGPKLEPAGKARRPGPVRFGFLAEIEPRKGLRPLVDGFIAWQRETDNDAELHVAGKARPGSERYFAETKLASATAPRPDKIIFRGALRGLQRDEFYEEIDFFVTSTQFESFGLTPLEAMWHGKPVMVTENLGVLEFISDRDCFISFGTGNPEEISRAFGQAMSNKESYLAAARQRRSRQVASLSGELLALRFAEELGLRTDFMQGAGR